MPRSDWKFMKDFIFPIPDIKTQKETANLFSAIDNKLELLEKKHQAYEDFKKYLMQQMIINLSYWKRNIKHMKILRSI